MRKEKEQLVLDQMIKEKSRFQIPQWCQGHSALYWQPVALSKAISSVSKQEASRSQSVLTGATDPAASNRRTIAITAVPFTNNDEDDEEEDDAGARPKTDRRDEVATVLENLIFFGVRNDAEN